MAQREHGLTVTLSPRAVRQLNEIYAFSLGKHGARVADRYLELLTERIQSLSTEHALGRTVDVRPELRYALIKMRQGADGHVAVYSVDRANATVDVLFVFHTKQDWKSQR